MTVESLLMLGPLNSIELVVVELDVVVVLVGAGAVVAGGNEAEVDVLVSPASSDPPPPQAAARRASASATNVMRFMGREDKSARALDDGFREQA